MQSWPAGHTVPHAPQLEGSFCVSRHDPVQLVRSAGHESWQRPSEHTLPAGHATPHAPQLRLSLRTSTQRSVQYVCPAEHSTAQRPV